MIARGSRDAFAERLNYYRQRIDNKLAEILRSEQHIPSRLREAMQYAVLGNGKRVRPLLAYASGELCGVPEHAIDTIAASVELVHAYSLVHDDLPAMDDDDLRRGRPTAHRAFDEATAILAGDALQALAFEILCTDETLAERAERQINIIRWLAAAVGPAGMVAGQALDIEAEGKQLDEKALEEIHRRKTGQLIRAAIMMPSELADLSTEARQNLDVFARDIGLVFQIRDDLLEVEQDTAALGKSATSDAANRKSTYPSTLGLERARHRAADIQRRAVAALETLGESSRGLLWLADFILQRSY